MKQINWLGVVLGFVVSELIGMAWYGMLFAEKWVAAVHPDMDPKADQVMPMIAGALDVLVMVVALGWLIARLNWNSLAGGAKAGLIAAIGFTAPGVILDPIYAGRTLELMAIEAGYVTVLLVISGALIGAVRMPAKKMAAA